MLIDHSTINIHIKNSVTSEYNNHWVQPYPTLVSLKATTKSATQSHTAMVMCATGKMVILSQARLTIYVTQLSKLASPNWLGMQVSKAPSIQFKTATTSSNGALNLLVLSALNLRYHKYRDNV